MITLFACAYVVQTGVVLDAAEPELRTYDGTPVLLRLDEASAPIAYLDGCIIEVEGPKVGGRVRVKDWTVKDAGDGSGGFVGVLRAWGGRIVMDDRNTGTTLILDDGMSELLRPWVGQPVLVVGTVVGGNVVQPMAWRLLAEEDAAVPDPG
jgi:hypothetical protein